MYPYFSAGYHVSAGVSPVGNLVLLVLQCSLQNDALEQGLIWATKLKHWATTFHESGCPGTTMFWGDLSSTGTCIIFIEICLRDFNLSVCFLHQDCPLVSH